MTRDEILAILEAVVPKASRPYGAPSRQDWIALESRFGTTFPDDFVTFMDLLSGYDFPGDVYNVATGAPSSGNDYITDVYDLESQASSWPRWLVPFYGIGNGDYFGLDARAGAASPIYYWYHDRAEANLYANSFEEWLRGLAQFLQG